MAVDVPVPRDLLVKVFSSLPCAPNPLLSNIQDLLVLLIDSLELEEVVAVDSLCFVTPNAYPCVGGGP